MVGLHPALGGQLREERELVKGAVAVAFEADGVDLCGTQFSHDVEVGCQRRHVRVRPDHQTFAQRDAHVAVGHRGQKFPAQRGVVHE